MKINKKGFVAGAVVGAGVAAAALAGTGLSFPSAQAEVSRPALVRASGPAIFAPPPGAPLSFADIFDRVSPAVVSIDVSQRVNRRTLRGIPGLENFPFDLLPRQPGSPGGETPQDGNPGADEGENLPEAQASGSGFFISADGYIVTNNHVVENATEITVRLKDERELKATIVGRDEDTDLAVLKVQGSNFPFVTFENSARPRVGDWIIAVGNPFGLGGSATAGIVSAYGRDIGEAFVDYIQIDAPINRGNSGGPTFDIYGRVIGVNTAIFSPTGGSVGIGFAIPADTADNITKQLIRNGKIERGYLGVSVGNVTEDVAEALNLQNRDGAFVSEVTPGGPAERGGVQPGDIIVRVNGQPVTSSSELTRRVGQARAGDTLRIEVLRNGRPQTLEVRSGTRPSRAELERSPTEDNDSPTRPTPGAAGTNVLGLTVTPIDAGARTRFSLPAQTRGLVVTGVNRTSEAGRKGFRAGDVILRADNRPVTSVAELQGVITALRNANRPSVLLLIQRDGRNNVVTLSLREGGGSQ
jgi:serine protease Do